MSQKQIQIGECYVNSKFVFNESGLYVFSDVSSIFMILEKRCVFDMNKLKNDFFFHL